MILGDSRFLVKEVFIYPEQTAEEKERLDYGANIVDTMICGCCGEIISKKPKGTLFNIQDRSWKCEFCGGIWFSSDGWYEEDNYLIPYR